jgi:hypothetical protein
MHGRYSKGWIYTQTLTPLFDADPMSWAIIEGMLEVENLPETHESIGEFLGKIRARVGEPSSPGTSGDDLLTEYCLECDAMHEDLDFLLYEMDLSVTRLHETALDERRMALLYHMDNFTLRIAAYREKVFQLVNQVLGLKVDPKNRGLRDRVRHLLRERGWASIDDLLLRFERDSPIATIVERRHALLHRIAFRPSETLRARRRAEDSANPLDPISKIDRLTYVENLHDRIQREFGAVCNVLAEFRTNLADSLRKVRSTSSSGGRA